MVERQIYGQENRRKVHDQRHNGAEYESSGIDGKPEVLRDALYNKHACRHENNGGDKKAQSYSPHL